MHLLPNRIPNDFAAHECILAGTPETLEQVYRLRHDCYLSKGSIQARSNRAFSDEFDALPNSHSFLVRSEDRKPLATVRISVVRPDVGWTDSPGARVFGDHPAFQAMRGGGYVEASRLCFGEQARRDAFVKLLGNMAALADLHQTEWLVACPRLEHAGFYSRMFGFREMAPARQYFGVAFQTQLLGIRRSELRERVGPVKAMMNAWMGAFTELQRSMEAPGFRTC
jgi:hypothetical protein